MLHIENRRAELGGRIDRRICGREHLPDKTVFGDLHVPIWLPHAWGLDRQCRVPEADNACETKSERCSRADSCDERHQWLCLLLEIAAN